MLLRLVRLLEQRGVDPNALLGDLRLAPDARIPYAVVDEAIERTARRLGAAGLGLALAHVRDDAAYGAAGLLLLASDNLRQGLSLAFAYQRVWGDGERFTLEAVPDGCAIRFRHPGPSRIARAVLAECALVETMECARTLVDPDARPLRVEWMHDPFDDSDALARYFGVEPSYGNGANAIVFEDVLATRPMSLRRTLLRSVFEAQCRQVLDQLPDATSIAQRVRQLLPAMLDRPLGITQVAARLRMSHRTLQRKLQAEGTSFRALVDGVRRARAETLAVEGAAKKEAALRLGFSDPSGFLRARRRWRG